MRRLHPLSLFRKTATPVQIVLAALFTFTILAAPPSIYGAPINVGADSIKTVGCR